MLGGCRLCLIFHTLGTIILKQALNIVAVRSIAAESVLVKEPLDATAGADLVGASLRAYWPAHFAMPAAP